MVYIQRVAARLYGRKALVTSVPKAGTHLLVHTLGLFPRLRDEGTIVRLSLADQTARIAAMRRGTILSTHLKPHTELLDVIASNGITPFFILRDPRDVCVSLMHYIKKEPDHYFHRFLDLVSGDDALLSAIITGYSEPRGDERAFLSSIDRTFRARLGWLNVASCCTVRFEDLVGEAGGGDHQRQQVELGRIARHLGCRLSPDEFGAIGAKVFSTGTTTFRRGRLGDWAETFSPEHRTLFKAVAGPLLVELGYEADLDW